MSNAKIIAIANQKGGVGKTSTSNAFAAGLKRCGYKVLAIDMDPQGNLSSSVDADVSEDANTIMEVMKSSVPASRAIQSLPAFDIIPADLSLASFEQDLISCTFGRDVRLKEKISYLRAAYDYIIIDTAPSLSMLTINALVAADCVIVPATAAYFATAGLEQLVKTIRDVRQYSGNTDLKLAGVLITMYNPRTINGRAIREATEKYTAAIGTSTYKTYIRDAVAMEESQTNRLDIFTFAPKSTVARDYMSFIKEFLAAEGGEHNGR